MGLNLCVQIPDTILLWLYSCLANRFLSSSFTMIHAWGRPYTPFRISTYKLPSVVAFSYRLYSFMISSEMSHSFILRYSYLVMEVIR